MRAELSTGRRLALFGVALGVLFAGGAAVGAAAGPIHLGDDPPPAVATMPATSHPAGHGQP